MDVARLLNFTVVGIGTAAVYAIAASGLVVTYTTSGIFNFAHGAFGMIAAFVYWQLHVGWGLPIWVALPLVVLVGAPLFGAGVERTIMRGLEGASEIVKVVVTVSLLVALLAVAEWVWPSGVSRSFPQFFTGQVVQIGDVRVPYHTFTVLGVAVAVAIALRLVLYRTRTGVAMRAVVDDRPLAQLNGVRPGLVSMASWALGASLAAVAGILIGAGAPLQGAKLTLLVINSFAAAVVGRLRSLPMTFLGALILGLAEAYVAAYVDSSWQIGPIGFTSVGAAVSPLMLLLVMVFLPQSRLRAGGVQRQREHWPVPTWRIALIGAGALVLVTWGAIDVMPARGVVQMAYASYLALVALSLVPLTGYAGQISLAPLTFAGIGGVIAGYMGASWSPWGILIGAAITAVAGAVMALPALRLTGIYLALGTVAFAMLASAMFFNQYELMPGGNRQVPPLRIGDWSASDAKTQTMVGVAAFALVGLGLVALRRGAWGRRLSAMKDSPVACATLGLNLTLTKVGVFALSAGIAGLGGAVSGRTMLSEEFQVAAGLPLAMLAVVGGVGAVSGALIGGLLFGASPIISTTFAANFVGIFKLVEVPVTKLNQVLPGLLGISLGRNPSGISSELSKRLGDVGRSNEALGVGGVGLLGIWALRKADVIDGWTLLAAALVLLLGVMPVVPELRGRARAAATTPRSAVVRALVWALVVLGVTLVVPWGTAIESNGVRFVAIIALVAVAVIVCEAMLGLVQTSVLPSPDLLGVDRPLTRSDVIDAERALGVLDGELGEEVSGVVAARG